LGTAAHVGITATNGPFKTSQHEENLNMKTSQYQLTPFTAKFWL